MSDQEDTNIDDLIMRYLVRHVNHIELEALENAYFEHACILDNIEQARLYLQRERSD